MNEIPLGQRLKAKAFFFGSSSSSSTYTCLLYTDGSTSCDCAGWTRRVQRIGDRIIRECKHTRYVIAGLGDQLADSTISYTDTIPEPKGPTRGGKDCTPAVDLNKRSFDFNQ